MKVTGIQIPASGVSKLQQSISLNEGKIIKAEVMHVKGEQIKLKLGKTIIDAKTKVALQQGDNLKLLVESMKDNIIKLKIIPQGETIKPESILLSRMGLTPSERLESMVGELLKFKMPVSGQILGELTGFTKLHDIPKETLPLLMWLKSSGIEVQSKQDVEALLHLQRFFTEILSEGEENKFFNFLNKTESMVLGGHNIYGWPLGENRIYLLTNNSKNEKLDPNNCSIVVKTVSEYFEGLWFKINYQNNSLDVIIHCDNEKRKKILSGEINLLEENLSQLGYNIKNIQIETKSINSIFDVITNSKKEITGVNYKV
ncbi:hypothetical protein SAMN00017405_0936 [Desulfonispora thiosulfatigenes DSM 11270]|uniref:Hook-length control protein FliK n=1 Tax=Desulfonispora thiosulfatigenes DSM 11270 TaxID=656914 RepID=A0A1W1UN79_DESTI|nr:hypothetical protein [Desulfonispora thiosulfatigenes]SMB82530.1 hypothetical protein SAMN00017405_0936 [Desulfonispora thiosulfatigenes DSM 11270]